MRKLIVVILVTCLIAIDVLAASTLWFRELHVQEQSRNEALKSQILDLQTTKNSLLQENEALLIQKQNLEDEVNTLKIEVDQAYDDGYLL